MDYLDILHETPQSLKTSIEYSSVDSVLIQKSDSRPLGSYCQLLTKNIAKTWHREASLGSDS